jgi:single-stranded DNA-binding protein
VYIHGSKLRFDLESKTYSLNGGVVAQVTEAFPVFNDVILTGRCIKDIDQTDARAFKTTADGLMIANQTLSVNTGRNQADLFNFYAINTAQDKFNQAELLVNMTRKGTGLTIRARIVTDAWTDKETNQRRSVTKLQLVQMTLAPKTSESQTKQVTSQTTVASTENVASLWGGKTVEESSDPWNAGPNTGLPDLPGQYGNAPEFNDEPPF